MKIAISHKHVKIVPSVELFLERHIVKIGTLLKSYAPDLVQLHGTFENPPHRTGSIFSVNLSLPTGTLHATGAGRDARGSVRQAFAELTAQIKKHQSLLRKDYEWRRKRGRAEHALA